MVAFFKKDKNWRIIAVFIVILLGALLIRFGMTREVTIFVDGEPLSIRTPAMTVSGVLRAAGVPFDVADRVKPAIGKFLWDQTVIHVDHAVQYVIHTPDEDHVLLTPERVPANLLKTIGIELYPQDILRVNGAVIDPLEPLDGLSSFFIQYEPAVSFTLSIDGVESTYFTNQATLGAALDDAGIYLSAQDWISEPLTNAVNEGMRVTLRRARSVRVRMGEVTISGLSAAETVGGALQDVGVPLQNLDYSVPAEDALVPENAEIEVVRVREDVLLTTEEVAYQNTYVEDPNTLLDQISVVEPGQVGIYAARQRVRYANGEEVLRIAQDTWQASEAKDGVLGYGTRIEIRTEVVDGVTIEYWRKKYVYATSYEPCDSQGNCYDGTAGGYPLQRGIVAVTPQWYSVPNGLAMADLPVYVPGYGRAIIGDVGGGIPGTPWIDLAYRPEDDFTWDAHWVTMYFLTPVPDYYPAIIVP